MKAPAVVSLSWPQSGRGMLRPDEAFHVRTQRLRLGVPHVPAGHEGQCTRRSRRSWGGVQRFFGGNGTEVSMKTHYEPP